MNRQCWLCGKNGSSDPLDLHHIFGGQNRSKSDKLGLVVYLCHDSCHIFGPNAAHRNRDTRLMLRRHGQLKAMEEQGWTEEEFVREFGRSWL